ncbi:hypothetical protein Tco_1275023 [Tanacetum coccineum]
MENNTPCGEFLTTETNHPLWRFEENGDGRKKMAARWWRAVAVVVLVVARVGKDHWSLINSFEVSDETGVPSESDL